MDTTEVLGRTRSIFEQTHWRTGAFGSWDAHEGKAKFCSVGGLRFISRGNDADDVPPVEVGRRVGVVYEHTAEFVAYFESLRAVALAVLEQDQLGDGEVGELPVSEPGLRLLEQIVVEWNDSGIRLDAVLEVFERAEEIAEARQV